MLPYSPSFIMDSSNNYGIMKTEAVFRFGPPSSNFANFSEPEPMSWIFNDGQFQKRSLQSSQVEKLSTKKPTFSVNIKIPKTSERTKEKNKPNKGTKSNKRKSKKVNKCIIKFMKEGERGSQEFQKRKKNKRRKQGSGYQKMKKKYMMPVMIGVLAAKSILIPIVLKALAFLTTKGVILAFLSTIMASVISFKGMFYNNPHRKEDTRTQVEIIQVPPQTEDHIYYDDEHITRGDHNLISVPNFTRRDHNVVSVPSAGTEVIGVIPNNMILNKKSDILINKERVNKYNFKKINNHSKIVSKLSKKKISFDNKQI